MSELIKKKDPETERASCYWPINTDLLLTSINLELTLYLLKQHIHLTLICCVRLFSSPHSLANVALCTSSLLPGSRDSVQQLVMMVWAINTVTL